MTKPPLNAVLTLPSFTACKKAGGSATASFFSASSFWRSRRVCWRWIWRIESAERRARASGLSVEDMGRGDGGFGFGGCGGMKEGVDE